ncbi:MAG: helix-turn-helix transcriptional regulator [Nitrosopumilaceae archaeon]|nr:helix-turn-helix transcriptional regulator [Nitrosopumilaceae archaeon]
MYTIKAEVTPRLLSWARRRRGVGTPGIAKKLGVSPQTVADWERGDKMPTFRQAQRFARALYVPFGYLYLREPPSRRCRLPTFGPQDRVDQRPVPTSLTCPTTPWQAAVAQGAQGVRGGGLSSIRRPFWYRGLGDGGGRRHTGHA